MARLSSRAGVLGAADAWSTGIIGEDRTEVFSSGKMWEVLEEGLLEWSKSPKGGRSSLSPVVGDMVLPTEEDERAAFASRNLATEMEAEADCVRSCGLDPEARNVGMWSKYEDEPTDGVGELGRVLNGDIGTSETSVSTRDESVGWSSRIAVTFLNDLRWNESAEAEMGARSAGVDAPEVGMGIVGTVDVDGDAEKCSTEADRFGKLRAGLFVSGGSTSPGRVCCRSGCPPFPAVATEGVVLLVSSWGVFGFSLDDECEFECDRLNKDRLLWLLGLSDGDLPDSRRSDERLRVIGFTSSECCPESPVIPGMFSIPRDSESLDFRRLKTGIRIACKCK